MLWADTLKLQKKHLWLCNILAIYSKYETFFESYLLYVLCKHQLNSFPSDRSVSIHFAPVFALNRVRRSRFQGNTSNRAAAVASHNLLSLFISRTRLHTYKRCRRWRGYEPEKTRNKKLVDSNFHQIRDKLMIV